MQASDLTKAYDGAPLFDGLSFVLADGERAGLVGPNGVGKSALLRLLAGVERPDRGAAATGGDERIGWLPQEAPDAATTLGELLGAGLGEVWTVRDELRALLERMATGDTSPGTVERYGQAQARFETLGGWALEASLEEARRALGIEHLDPLRGRLQRSSSAARGAQGEACPRIRGSAEATTTPRGRHRADAPPGAAHRAHREPRRRPQAHALRQEGRAEGEGARGPAAARARGRSRRDAAGGARGAAAAPGDPGSRA
ncbi:MAG TPA: ATP-binding cassette domain-containing protein, partial [Solirubrobacteraceae bacterium]|nr:ATP-binding cassette domain-containing protein [Solirubrobacteraceae bacterium]